MNKKSIRHIAARVFIPHSFALSLQPPDGLRAMLLRDREGKTAVLDPIWKTEQVCRLRLDPHFPTWMLKDPNEMNCFKGDLSAYLYGNISANEWKQETSCLKVF